MPGGYADAGNIAEGVNPYLQFREVVRTIYNFLPLPTLSSLNLNLRFGFVPTYSSVAYTGDTPAQMNPNLNLNSLSKNNGTPFDRLIFDNTNKEHADGRRDPTFNLLLTELQATYPGYYGCSSALPPVPDTQLSQVLNFTYPSCLYGYFYASPVDLDRIHYGYNWTLTCNGQFIRNESGSPQFYFRADRQGCFTVTLTVRDIINSPYPSATVSRVVCPPGVCQSGQGRTGVAEPTPEPDEYLQISPNPGDKEITILFVTPAQAPATMQITTVSGVVIKQVNQWLPVKPGYYQYVLDGSALAEAVYIVTVTSGTRRISSKLLIHH